MQLTSVPASTLRAALIFIYSGRLEVTDLSQLVSLQQLATSFQITELSKACHHLLEVQGQTKATVTTTLATEQG